MQEPLRVFRKEAFSGGKCHFRFWFRSTAIVEPLSKILPVQSCRNVNPTRGVRQVGRAI